MGGLAQGAAGQASVEWTPSGGTHQVEVRADSPLSHVTELDETNNRFVGEIPALNIIYADLVVADLVLWPADGRVINGQPVVAYVTVRNPSAVAVPMDVPVELRAGGEIVAAGVVGGLAGGETKTVRLVWPAGPGTYNVEAVIDPDNLVPETSGANNAATLAGFQVTLTQPDYTPAELAVQGDLRFGQTVTVKVRVDNPGTGYDTAPFNVRLLVDERVVAAQRITQPILAGGHRYVYFSWAIDAATPVHGTLSAVVDANNEAAETSETNNRRDLAFSVAPGYHAALLTDSGVYGEGEAVLVTLSVADAATGQPAGPAAGLSAALTIFDAAGSPIHAVAMTWDDAAGIFTAALPPGLLAAGAYRAEAVVTGPLQTQAASAAFSVAAPFTAAVATDRPAHGLGQDVLITGSLAGAGGGVAGAAVEILIRHDGGARRLYATTLADGSFAATFTPLTGEGGAYTVEAAATVNGLRRTAAAAFAVEGVACSPGLAAFSLSEGATHDVVFDLTNVGLAAQGGLAVSVVVLDGPAGYGAAVDASALPAALAPGAGGQVRVTFAPGAFVGTVRLEVIVASTSGGQAYETRATVTATSVAAAPVLTVDTAAIQAGLPQASETTQTIILTNTGTAPLTGLAVAGPGLPWITISGPGVATLAPGRSATVLVRFAPGADVPENAYAGGLTITSNAGQTIVPVAVEVTNQATGALRLVATDSLGRRVRGADVEVFLHEPLITGGVDAGVIEASRYRRATTDDDGEAVIGDLLAGAYLVRITSAGRRTLETFVEVHPGETPTEAPAALDLNPFALTWTQEASTETLTLGQWNLGLVMSAADGAVLMTDRPGAEYFIYRNGATGPDAQAFMRLDAARPFPENTSFSLNNVSAEDLRDLGLTVTGGLAPYITLNATAIAVLPAGRSALLSYTLNVNLADVPNPDLPSVLDGAIVIESAGGVSLTFPIRVNVRPDAGDPAAAETLVPYSGPWPTGPVLYTPAFIETWFDGAAAATQPSGHDLARAELAQDTVVEGEAVRLYVTLTNTLAAETLTVTGAHIRILDPSAAPGQEDVTALFDLDALAPPAAALAPGASAAGAWQLVPRPGTGVGGTDPAGRTYQVFVDVDYDLGGAAGRQALGPLSITILPQPEFVIRYEVQGDLYGDPNQVGVTVYLSNVGAGAATGVVVGAPDISLYATTAFVMDPQPLVFDVVEAGETVSGSWTLYFSRPPDLAAVVSAFEGGDASWTSPAGQARFDLPVMEGFVGSHTMNDLRQALEDLLTAAQAKIDAEWDTLLEAFDTLGEMVRLTVQAWTLDASALADYIYSLSLANATQVVPNRQTMMRLLARQALDPDTFTDADAQQLARAVSDLAAGVTGFAAGLEDLLQTALAGRAAQVDLERLYADLVSLWASGTAVDLASYLRANTPYFNLKPYLAWEELDALGDSATPEQVLDVLDLVIGAGGQSVRGQDNVNFLLHDLVSQTRMLLGEVKSTAVFPMDLLYDEITTLTEIISLYATGVGRDEWFRSQVQPVWYAAGEPGEWRPVFLQGWTFGGVNDYVLRMERFEAMQWENIEFHYDWYASASLLTGIMNAHNANLLAFSPAGGAMGLFTQAMTKDAIGYYFEAMNNLRTSEYGNNMGMLRAMMKFLMAHQYETAGLWRMFEDIRNHVDYLIQHNPVDPAVTLAMESLSFPNVLVDDGLPFGIGDAEITFTNTSTMNLVVTPTVTVASDGEIVGTFPGETVSVAAGGVYTATLTVSGTDAQTGAPVVQTVAVTLRLDRAAPAAPQVDAIPATVSALPLDVTGTAEPGATVRVLLGGEIAAEARAGADGAWAVSLLRVGMGTYDLTAVAVDAAGNREVTRLAYVQVDTSAPSVVSCQSVAEHAALGDDGGESVTRRPPRIPGGVQVPPPADPDVPAPPTDLETDDGPTPPPDPFDGVRLPIYMGHDNPDPNLPVAPAAPRGPVQVLPSVTAAPPRMPALASAEGWVQAALSPAAAPLPVALADAGPATADADDLLAVVAAIPVWHTVAGSPANLADETARDPAHPDAEAETSPLTAGEDLDFDLLAEADPARRTAAAFDGGRFRRIVDVSPGLKGVAVRSVTTSAGRAAAMALAVALLLGAGAAARADYTVTLLSGGLGAATVQPGDLLTLDVVVSGDPADVHDAAILRLEFTDGGLAYLGYLWAAPYANGTPDDDSKPLLGALPAVLDAATLSGTGYPAGVVDVELSNVTDGAGGPPPAFASGTLATVTLRVPDDWSGPGLVGIGVRPDTFSRGFAVVPASAGPDFMLTIVPEPATLALMAAGALALLARRRRAQPEPEGRLPL